MGLKDRDLLSPPHFRLLPLLAFCPLPCDQDSAAVSKPASVCGGQDAPAAKPAAGGDKKKAKAAKDVDVKAAKGSSTIFVKNLAWAVGEDELYEFFGSCGEVLEARIGEFVKPEQ